MTRKTCLWIGRFGLAAMMSVANLRVAQAQAFNSGSDGSDGALNLTTPGTYIFDPDDVGTFGRVLDPDRNFIYHFTTINIGAGVTLKIRANKVPGALHWLAQGEVMIAGTLDIKGDDGVLAQSIATSRFPSVAGPGGFSGGVGAFGSQSAQRGFGPFGGALSVDCSMGFGGGTSANIFLVPLVGGSGGGGSYTGGSGGAGGGAILIASSTSVTVSGIVDASGGGNAATNVAGRGAGGSIRLAAPTVSGNGQLDVRSGPGGSSGCNGTAAGANGRVRIEAFQHNYTGAINGNVTRATLFNTFAPTAAPATVRLMNIGGIAVPASPNGNFTVPDVVINTSAAVTFTVQAANIPLGAIVTLYLYSEDGADQTIDCTPLAGTLQSSTATASAIIPTGFSRGLVRATWTQ